MSSKYLTSDVLSPMHWFAFKGTATLFGPSMAALQGPAFVVYDNAVFQPEDFVGLRSFGRG